MGTNIFQDCTSLQTVDFGLNSKITTIPTYMFGGCTSLRQVYNLPDTIKTIGKNAFLDCRFLSTLGFENTYISWQVCEEEDFSTAITTISASEFSSSYITLLTETYDSYYWRKI